MTTVTLPDFWTHLFGYFCGALAFVVILMVILSWMMKPLAYAGGKPAEAWSAGKDDLTLKN